jgi:hypothetical protein
MAGFMMILFKNASRAKCGQILKIECHVYFIPPYPPNRDRRDEQRGPDLRGMALCRSDPAH